MKGDTAAVVFACCCREFRRSGRGGSQPSEGRGCGDAFEAVVVVQVSSRTSHQAFGRAEDVGRAAVLPPARRAVSARHAAGV
ncbi:hypothetical protein [Nocardioides alcanivorans]|uniref:hypothetical protein n=1 Tax=Nocardioides alcanivorans TaxID=2897352 RepID=UPI001F376AC7|nr:hypothetical protein [Nocardioides alcanivorans]